MTLEEQIEAYYTGRTLLWRQQLEAMTDEAVATLKKTLTKIKREVMKELRNNANGLLSLSEWRKEYDEDLNKWLDEVLASANAQTLSIISEMSINAALASVTVYNSILSLEDKAKSVIQLSGLTREQVQQFFVEQPLGGWLLSDWVNTAFSEGAKASIAEAIHTGVIRGEGYEKIINRIMKASDFGFQITWKQADTLARTYVASANNGAREAVYKKNEDIFRGYVRVETLDNHTCRICSLADGTFYKIGELRPRLPAHPRCRGDYVPRLKGWNELGTEEGESELRDFTRPWAIRGQGNLAKANGAKVLFGGRIKGDFETWWKTLTAAQQADTGVGPIRSKLLREGLVKWQDLSDKKTGLPYTLKQLGFDEQGNPLR